MSQVEQLKFPTGLKIPLEQLTLQVWCNLSFILFSPQPDIQNLFYSPGKWNSFDKLKVGKRFLATPAAMVYE